MRLGLVVLAAAVGVATGSWVLGGQMIQTHHRPVGPAPSDLPAEAVTMSGVWGDLSGWRIGDVDGRSCVLLLHGIGGDRRDMLSRGRMLYEAGYGVLALDQQGHGESDGAAVAFGARARWDAVTGVTALRGWGCSRVGVLGVSMGGAAALLAGEELDADAVIVEQVYATLEEAADARLTQNVGVAGPLLRRLLLLQLGPRLGLAATDVRPIEHIDAIHAPILVMAGERDWRAPPEAAQRLAEAATSPTELWIVPEAGHESLHHRQGAAYEERVLRFLGKWLAPRT
mgnify:CR=1 FL=1